MKTAKPTTTKYYAQRLGTTQTFPHVNQPRNKTPRFLVPENTLVSVCRADQRDNGWIKYTTTKPCEFDRYETYRNGAYVFRHGLWLMLVANHKVSSLLGNQ